MPNSTADNFAERMKLLASQQDASSPTRPGLVSAMANGTATPDQLVLISNFVKALDLAKVATANNAAGINVETDPQNADLLMSIGEDKSIVQRANSATSAAADPNAANSFMNNTFQTIAQYSANSGDVIFPQSNSFAPGNKAPDGSSNDNIFQDAWKGVLTGLSWIGRLSGYAYQGAKLSGVVGGQGSSDQAAQVASIALGMDASGYGKTANIGDVGAYVWSHGESDFNDLGAVRAAHGAALTNTAVAMFQADTGYGSAARTLTGNTDFQQALSNYQGVLNEQLQSGKITPQQFAEQTKNLSQPDLQSAYEAVDAQHVSFGRDLARNIGLDPASGAGHYVSGLGDFTWSMVADPTIVGSKIHASIVAAKYGAEALADTSKLAKLYGVADKVTGELPAKLNPILDAGALQAQRRLGTYLSYNAAIRDAEASGNKALAASLYAENAARHKDFMPSYMEAQGWRAASTPEEIAKAKAEGTSLTLGGDAIHEAMAPSRGGHTPEAIAASVKAFKDASIPAVLKAKPIETPEEWVDWLGAQGGLYRLFTGAAIRQARVLPGKMSYAAEARAGVLGRMAFNRVLAGSDRNPFLAALLQGGEHLAAHGGGNLGVIDTEADAGKIIPSDASEAFKTAAAAAASGQVIGGRDAGSWLNFARSLKGTADATVRRLTTWLPTNHFIALNSTQASADMERFVRTFMSKDTAGTARYMWDAQTSEAGRRQIGRAIVNQVADASGITRSPAGKAWMAEWNAGFDELNNVRYGMADTDKVLDVYRGEKRVALNLSQLETHLVLPSFTKMRQVAAKAAIHGFEQPVDQIGSKSLRKMLQGDAMKSWVTNADGTRDIMHGVRRMLASPSATVRYGLFNNQILTRAFGVMKLGWLGTTSNMLRQFAEEYVGLRLGRHGADLAEGKRLLRADGATTALVAKAHHLIPHALRPSISSEGDLYNAVSRGRLDLALGERPLTDEDRQITQDLSDMITQREVLELLGGRQATLTEGGVQDAIDAHTHNVQMQRTGWKRAQLTGYTESDLKGDAGRRALAAWYTNLFIDPDEPARRILAYHMWNQSASNPKFLKELSPETIRLMHSLVPVDDASLASALAGEAKGITPPLTDSIKDYVKNAPGAGPLRNRAEFLKLDETGRPIADADEVSKDAAIERYVHTQVFNVGQSVFRSDGKTMRPDLVSDLLAGKTPADVDLAKIPEKDLPEHVIQAEFAPMPVGKSDKLGEAISKAASMGGKAFDHIVTNPMQRLERKPLFYGNYSRAYKELGRYRSIMAEQGFSAEDQQAITRRMALGRALQDTTRYLDNPKVASQLSAVAQNFWLFYRAQEDFVRRWIGVIKERPESLRIAQMAVQGAVHSGMLYRDSDGNLQLAYPGSGGVIDAFLMAQEGLGIDGNSGIKIPAAHDLTTQLNFLNPSLMNPTGFSATPMVNIPWDVLKLAIPGHDMVKSQVDMAFNGQLGNGRAWWEQFMPTEINRIMQLQGGHPDTGDLVGAAAATAIQNASIAGQLNDAADDVVRQHKIADLKTMTLGAMWARALFAYVAPGATSSAELDYKDANGNFIGDPEADASWRAMGIKNMHDEFLAMVQKFGSDKAMVVWQELHPNLLPYTVGKTTLAAASANVDPTMGATQWVFDNKSLFEGPYARVAAYFIPSAPGTFDQAGWNAMTEIGVRQHKDLDQYYLDIASKNAVTAWYQAKDKYDPEIAKMKAAGQRTTELEDEYTTVKNNLKAEYPILTTYFAEHSSRQNSRTQMVGELRTMVKDPSVNLPVLAGVAQMLTVLDNYNAKQADLKGQRSTWAESERQDLNSEYESTMAGITKRFPDLTDLYNGVFRELEQ